MIVRYLSHQNKCDPLNGHAIAGRGQLNELLNSRRDRPPFIAELSADNGFQVVVGISRDFCCAEHRWINGDPPYLMAVSAHPLVKSGCIEFLAANTPTPIAARYIITFDELKIVALRFLETGGRSEAVSWQIFDPKAGKEDAELPPGS